MLLWVCALFSSPHSRAPQCETVRDFLHRGAEQMVLVHVKTKTCLCPVLWVLIMLSGVTLSRASVLISFSMKCTCVGEWVSEWSEPWGNNVVREGAFSNTYRTHDSVSHEENDWCNWRTKSNLSFSSVFMFVQIIYLFIFFVHEHHIFYIKSDLSWQV